MNWFQRFLFAWHYASIPSYERLADTPDYWGNEDAKITRQFFQGTDTGKKLSVLLNNFVFRQCYDAVSKVGDHDYHAGVARGTALAVFHLQNQFTQDFSPAPAQRSDLTEPGADAASMLEPYGVV